MTTVTTDELHNSIHEKPGALLARVREERGYSQEYVAGKLHLRVKIIELLEADAYEQMPEPVFIKGYFRAYAKLLGISVDPLLEIYNAMYSTERKLEKAALWQSTREPSKGERWVRLLTVAVIAGVVIVVGVLWQKNKDSSQLLATKNTVATENLSKVEADIKLTDLSKMRSMLLPNNNQVTPLEMQGG